MARPAPTFEALRERFERASHSVDRAHAAARARAVARRLDVAVPPWAALGHARRDRLDLEALRERHDRGALPPDRRARLRMLARQRAEAAGVAVPAWAAKGRPRAREAPLAMAARSIGTVPRSIGTPTAQKTRPPASPGRSIGTAPRSIATPRRHPERARTPNALTPTPREVPAPLRVWREARFGRVVQVRGERVTLHDRDGSRSFACVADAIAAVV